MNLPYTQMEVTMAAATIVLYRRIISVLKLLRELVLLLCISAYLVTGGCCQKTSIMADAEGEAVISRQVELSPSMSRTEVWKSY